MFPDYFPTERPPIIEQLRAESRGLKYRPAKRKKQRPFPPDYSALPSPFIVNTGARWMELGQREPVAKMLFAEFWHQGELCIMFADSNTGKSILAVQMGDNIARAQNTGPFVCDARAEKVLYVDFELTTAQFYQRYGSAEAEHEFSSNFFRAQLDPAAEVTDDFESYDDFLIASLEQKIMLVNATVLIIDNITCLRGGTENASVALRLMNNLKGLKADHNLSILVLAHTPKRRNPARPLSANDLHGSKLLINFADSAFAMGKSITNKNLCYLKQIKQRNTQQVYGEDKVCLCRISDSGSFLQFKFEGYSPERLHLPAGKAHHTTIDHQSLAKKISELSAKGLSQRSISRELNISLGLVNKLLKLRR
jgi:AAA domain-containing protein